MNLLGVEIRADALAVAHLKSSLLGLKVVGFDVFKGDTLKARVEGLKSRISGSAIKDPGLSVVLPRNATISRVIEVPAPDASAIGGILRFELEKHIPFKVEDAYWGFEAVGRKDKVFSVLFAAARKNTVDKIVGEFTEAGLTPHSVVFWQASVINALARWKNTALSADTAIVGLDAGTVTLDVISDMVPVYSKTISAGALREDGWSGAVKRELGAFLSSAAAREKKHECVVLSEEADEGGIIDALSNDLNLPVGPARLKGLGVPASAAPALGAAISALGKGRINIDLFAPSGAVKGSEHLKTLALSAAVALLLVLTGATYLVKDRLTLDRLDSALSEARLEKEKVDGLAGELKAADERIRALEGIKGMDSPGALEVLRELSVLLPAGTWLTGFEYNGGVVFIEGFSDSASAELLKMERSGLMRDAEFAGPVTKDRGGKEHFRIKFSVRDNEIKKTGKVAR
jgi:Tfp pilus assembly protein PilN